MNKIPAVFFDRDGVLNYDDEGYVYDPNHYTIYPEIPEIIKALAKAGYLLIVITNQAGIARGIYTREHMHSCHSILQQKTNNAFSHIYYSPYHPEVSESLSRKPGSLLFEKAIAKYNVDVENSWMVGDRDRDLIPAKKLGMKTIGVRRNEDFNYADHVITKLEDVIKLAIDNS